MEIKEKRTDMFGTLTPAIQQLFSDEKMKSVEQTQQERTRIQQELASAVRDELKEYFNSRRDSDADQKAAQGWMEAYSFMQDYGNRRFLSLHDYMCLCNSKFPILAGIYSSEYSYPASTAAVERSFSVQGYMMTDRRNKLLPKTIRNAMLLRMNTILGRKDTWYGDMNEYIKEKTRVTKK